MACRTSITQARARVLPGVLVVLGLAVAPAPVSAQEPPPGVTIEQWNALTPAQQQAILERLQQAGALRATIDTTAATGELPAILEPQAGIPDTLAIPPIDSLSMPEPPFRERPYDFGISSEDSLALAELELFGRDIFTMTPETFQPIVTGPVGPDYQIGPGDELVIQMWGEYNQVFTLTVNREGYILIPQVGRVVLSSLTVEQARQHLIRQMTPFYQALEYGREGATAFLDITLGRLRVITVYVLGEAVRQGAYTLSSLSTALTAVYAAGGVTNRGSMRAMRVIRGTREVTEIDLYDYLLRGDKSDDTRLRDGDIVFVPPVGPLVAVLGNVLRPAVYEIAGREDLKDLIGIAGGLTASAYRERAQIVRIVPPGDREQYAEDRITLDVSLSAVLADEQVLPLYDGDVLTVFPVLDLRRDFVDVAGAVWRAGRYQLEPDMHLLDLLARTDGLREEAWLERADIIRTNADYTTTQLRIDLAAAYSGDDSQNIPLQKLDRVIVYSIHDIAPERYVQVEGHVLQPGEYLLHEGMRVSDLLFRAGGLWDPDWRKEAWLEKADLIRTGADGITRTIISFDLGGLLDGDPTEDHLLRSGDLVRIYSVYSVRFLSYATIVGEVENPGEYEIEANTTVNDLIIRAGGLTREAWPEEVEIARIEPGEIESQRRASIIRAPIDTSFSGREGGLRLQDLDLVVVRRRPYWELQRNVQIAGEVVFPGLYSLENPNESISHLLERAGGLTPYAFPEAAQLYRSQGEAGRVGLNLMSAIENPGSRDDLTMMPGDSLHIPEFEPTVRVMGAVGYPSSILHASNRSLGYYIGRAGGYLRTADRRRVRVLLANGEIWYRRGLFPSGPDIGPGALIIVPVRPETTRDVWTVIRDTTAILSSLTTVLILIWRINK